MNNKTFNETLIILIENPKIKFSTQNLLHYYTQQQRTFKHSKDEKNHP